MITETKSVNIITLPLKADIFSLNSIISSDRTSAVKEYIKVTAIKTVKK